MTTRTEATDDLMGLINTAIKDKIDAIHWQGEDKPKPTADTSWARVTMHTHQEEQKTLGRYDGKRHYQSRGKVYVEVYLPVGLSLPEADDPAMLARTALRTSPTEHGVILRGATAREGGVDGGWNKTVVSVDFEYDEVA